jgi:hypothetical protein
MSLPNVLTMAVGTAAPDKIRRLLTTWSALLALSHPTPPHEAVLSQTNCVKKEPCLGIPPSGTPTIAEPCPFEVAGRRKSDERRSAHSHLRGRHARMSERMTNTSLRERFGLRENKSVTTSQVIATTIAAGLIKLDERVGTSRKLARYLLFSCARPPLLAQRTCGLGQTRRTPCAISVVAGRGFFGSRSDTPGFARVDRKPVASLRV